MAFNNAQRFLFCFSSWKLSLVLNVPITEILHFNRLTLREKGTIHHQCFYWLEQEWRRIDRVWLQIISTSKSFEQSFYSPTIFYNRQRTLEIIPEWFFVRFSYSKLDSTGPTFIFPLLYVETIINRETDTHSNDSEPIDTKNILTVLVLKAGQNFNRIFRSSTLCVVPLF